MERLGGYYWCKTEEGCWEVCFYNVDEKAFERTMDDSYTYDEEFEEIDEQRLTRPNDEHLCNPKYETTRRT